MKISVTIATDADALELAAVRNAAIEGLAQRYRLRQSLIPEARIVREIAGSSVLVARWGAQAAATLRLTTRKPWAIDLAYFTPAARALYLHDMAVHPDWQGRGIGRMLLENAKMQARAWPGQAIRLDAYDAAHGAGGFYARCGFNAVGRATYRGTPLIYYELLL